MSLKILFLSHKFYPDVGGIEVNSEILATAFHNAGHTVRLLTWSRGGNDERFPFAVKRNPSIVELLLLHRWADLVYENNVCLRLAWPSLLLFKPSVVAIRSLVSRPDGRREWQDKLKMRWLRRATSVIAVSDFIRRRTWPAATVIGNPYRADIFTAAKDCQRSRYFVFLGRLVSDKGADLAIKSIHQLLTGNDLSQATGHDGFVLTIIGDGPFRKDLELLADHLGVRDRVHFLGMLTGDALVSCLNSHKYILVPSICEEAFGNVVLEGMACGCIPIVSDAGGLPGAVGEAGLIFSKGDVNSLTSHIRHLLGNEVLENKLRKIAEIHLANHRPQVITKKYLEVIETATTDLS